MKEIFIHIYNQSAFSSNYFNFLQENIMFLYYLTQLNLCYVHIFPSKINLTMYARTSYRYAFALRRERVEGRGSNLSLLKEANGEREKRRL